MLAAFILVTVLVVAILGWNYRSKISLPGLGGVGTKVGGILSSLSSTSVNGTRRVEFLFLLGLVLFGTAIVMPSVYTWFWGNKGLTLFIALIVLGYVVKGPNSTFLLKMATIAILAIGIYGSLSTENILKKKWWPSKAEPDVTQAVPREVARQETQEAKIVSRTAELIATQYDFMWARVPDSATFDNFDCPPGTLMKVVHKGNPGGRTYDCDLKESIALGYGLLDLKLGFKSKSPETIPVVIRVLVSK